jgi:hypothetical protein
MPQQSPSSANFAPLKPLIQLRDKASPRPEHPIQKAMAERWSHYHRKDSDVWREIYSVMQLTALFISGDQILRRNPVTGGWGILNVTHSTTTPRSINYMQFYANMLSAKDLQSNPDVLISAGRNKDQCISAARAANAVKKHYNNEWYTPDFARNQSLLALTGGTYIRRIRFDNQKESNIVLADVFEQKPVETQGFGFCSDCQYTGGSDEFTANQSMAAMAQRAGQAEGMGGAPVDNMPAQQCPNCGSGSVQVQSGASQMLPSVTGQQKYSQGDLVCEQMPLFGCRFDLNKRIEDSSWAFYRQNISLGMIHLVMGNINVPQTSSQETGGDVGMEMMESLAKAGQALYGSSYSAYQNRKDEFKNGAYFDELWLSPEDYADIIIQRDEQTIDGGTLPKGKLTDTFPDGLVAVGLNGMTTLLGLHAEKHKDHIVSGAWNKKMLSGVGRGIADTVEVQKRANRLDTQRLDYIETIATPAVWYNKDIGDADKLKYLGSPHANIPFDMTKLPETAKLADVAYQFQPAQGLLGNMTEYIETFLNSGFAYTSGVTEFSSGLPGAAGANDTATGAQLEQSTADTVNMPIWAEKGDVLKRSTKILIKQYTKHFPNERTISLTGKYGEQQSIDLKGADLDTDLNYEVVKNSEIPTGPYQTRKNLNDMLMLTGGIEGYVMLVEQKPQMAAKIEQAFDVDLETDEFDDVAELCRKRLNQMKAALESGVNDPLALVGAMLDPMSGQMIPAPNGGAIQPPISPAEPNLKRKAQWFSDVLDTDEMQKAPMELRKACEMLAQGQIMYDTAQQSALAQSAGQVELAGQQPGMEAQQAMQPPQQPDQSAQLQAQQQQADQQQQEAQGQQQVVQQIGDALNQDAQRQHESSEADAARKHEANEASKERASKEKLARLQIQARRQQAKRKVA